MCLFMNVHKKHVLLCTSLSTRPLWGFAHDSQKNEGHNLVLVIARKDHVQVEMVAWSNWKSFFVSSDTKIPSGWAAS